MFSLLNAYNPQNGDKEKLDLLYRKYKRQMFGLAMSILHNKYDAEDAVHNAYLAIADHLDKVDDINSKRTKSFLSVIVRNESIDIAKENSLAPISLEELGEDYAASKTLEDEFFEKLDLEGAIRMFNELEPIYRDPLLLKYNHGFTNREIAKMMNVGYEAMCKRISRGEKLLFERCKEEGIVE